MTGSPHDPPESALPPLGPAISPRTSPRPSPLSEMSEPLAPFGAWPPSPAPDLPPAPDENRDREPLAPSPTGLDAIDSGSGAVDDLPWLTLEEVEGEVDQVAEYDAVAGFDEVEETDTVATGEGATAPEGWDAPRAAGAPEEPLIASPPPAARASGAEPAEAAAVAVAARLEEIARTLREHGPAGLLVGQGHDPLYLLIAGYALGRVASAQGDRPSQR